MKYIVTIFLFILISSCATDINNLNTDKIKVACLGDSITYGWGIENRNKNNYPGQLESSLGSNYIVESFGVIGATLLKNTNYPYWKSRRIKKIFNYQPDIVIIQLGTNDSKEKNWKDKNKFIHDYISIINEIKSEANDPKIIICSPLPTYKNIWGIRNEVIRDEIVSLIKIISNLTKVKIVDLYPLFVGKKELLPDNIHPNREGAQIISNAIYNEIIKF